MEQEKLLIKIDALKEQLLNLLTIWYKENTEVLNHILFHYDNIFGNIEKEIIQKEKNVKILEQKYKILEPRINNKEAISRKTINFIDKVLNEDSNKNNNLKNKFNPKDKSNLLDFSINDNVNITNLYRNIVKKLHPDIIGESNIFNLCWNNVQFCYNEKDIERLKMFHLILCEYSNNFDIKELEKDVKELEKYIEIQINHNNELKNKEPFCFADKLNNSDWIIERTNDLRNKLVQINKKIVHNNRLLRQMKLVD